MRELDENILPPYFNLAGLYRKNQSFDLAIEQYESVIESNPNLLPPYALLGILYTQQQNIPRANSYFEKALKINPDFAVAANNLAWNYAEHGGDLDQALSLAQTARKQAPNDPEIADTLGWVYYKKSIFGLAILQFKDCLAKLPDNPLVLYHLGMAYYKNGDKDPARETLQQALQLNQNFPGAQEARKVLQKLQ